MQYRDEVTHPSCKSVVQWLIFCHNNQRFPSAHVCRAAKSETACRDKEFVWDNSGNMMASKLLSPLALFCSSVCRFPLQLSQHIPARLGARVSLRPVGLLHHSHAAEAGWRRRRLLPHLSRQGREGRRGMEIGSIEHGGQKPDIQKKLQPGMDHSSLMESLVDGKNEHLLKKLEFEPGTLSLFRVRRNNMHMHFLFRNNDII